MGKERRKELASQKSLRKEGRGLDFWNKLAVFHSGIICNKLPINTKLIIPSGTRLTLLHSYAIYFVGNRSFLCQKVKAAIKSNKVHSFHQCKQLM